MEKINFTPVWFDSLGAKSSCVVVKTPNVKILIDPGIAVMQPSFPASLEKKIYWAEKGRKKIKKAGQEADVIIISHYHYDHFFPDDLTIYQGKKLFVKNPNEYINFSQRKRAEEFFKKICQKFGKAKLNSWLKKRKRKKYPSPLNSLRRAKEKNFKDYQKRREELLEKGQSWFKKLSKNWNCWPKIPELNFKEMKIKFPEKKEFKVGETKLKFSPPLFHGIEFSQVGWVFSTIIKYKNKKLIHTSDLSGIYLEDYAEWLIKENPEILILDGPATYLYGYFLNKINLKRCIKNTCRIIKKAKNLELLIYDHHLLREKNYQERTKKVWETAKKEGKKVVTAAEYLGKDPVVLKL